MPNAASKELGSRIGAARRIRGITVQKMAQVLRCSPQIYSRVEAGREPISLVMGAEISVYLSVNLRELLQGSEAGESPLSSLSGSRPV